MNSMGHSGVALHFLKIPEAPHWKGVASQSANKGCRAIGRSRRCRTYTIASRATVDNLLRGPAAVLSISCNTCFNSIAKLFRVLWGLVPESRDVLQNGMSHIYVCVSESTKGEATHTFSRGVLN